MLFITHRTVIEFHSPEMQEMNGAAIFFTAVGRFCLMFFASAAIGVGFGFVSAMISFYLINVAKNNIYYI